MRIRPAQTWDLPVIRDIYNDAVAERSATSDLKPKTLADRRKWFRQFNERHPIFVGTEAGEILAYGCLFEYSPKDGYRFAAENSVYVAATARGRGLGRLMLKHLIRRARALGLRYLCARVFTHNPASLKLHRRLGFRRVGVQKRISLMDGIWRDVVILELHL